MQFWDCIVTGFFIGHDAMVHRGTPSLPVSQASLSGACVSGGARIRGGKVPDMKSAGVAFASADVSPPAKIESAQNPPGNFATKEAVGPKKVRKVRVSRSVQEAHQRRLPARIATVRIQKEGRAAYAQSFFGFSSIRWILSPVRPQFRSRPLRKSACGGAIQPIFTVPRRYCSSPQMRSGMPASPRLDGQRRTVNCGIRKLFGRTSVPL